MKIWLQTRLIAGGIEVHPALLVAAAVLVGPEPAWDLLQGLWK